MVRELVPRLKLASSRRVEIDEKELTRRLAALVGLHLRPRELRGASKPALRRFVREAGPYLEELLLVSRCDTLAHLDPDTSPLDQLALELEALGPAAQIQKLESPLSGQEIMKLLGLPPGRAIGEAKQALVNAILDGEIPAEAGAATDWLLRRHGLA